MLSVIVEPAVENVEVEHDPHACAVRELRTAVMCDFHCAKGSYDVNPDHVGYPHARPTSVASFRDMWGSLCFTDGPTLEFTDILHIASR